MENTEIILDELEKFEKESSDSCDIPEILQEYLKSVSINGDPIFHWNRIKHLIRHKLNKVIGEFYDNFGYTAEHIESSNPNLPLFSYASARERIVQHFDRFTGIPFTIQRLCEILLEPTRHYRRIDKFLRGLEKNILVVSYIEPGRIKPPVEDSNSLMNGLEGGGYFLLGSPPNITVTHMKRNHNDAEVSGTSDGLNGDVSNNTNTHDLTEEDCPSPKRQKINQEGEGSQVRSILQERLQCGPSTTTETAHSPKAVLSTKFNEEMEDEDEPSHLSYLSLLAGSKKTTTLKQDKHKSSDSDEDDTNSNHDKENNVLLEEENKDLLVEETKDDVSSDIDKIDAATIKENIIQSEGKIKEMSTEGIERDAQSDEDNKSTLSNKNLPPKDCEEEPCISNKSNEELMNTDTANNSLLSPNKNNLAEEPHINKTIPSEEKNQEDTSSESSQCVEITNSDEIKQTEESQSPKKESDNSPENAEAICKSSDDMTKAESIQKNPIPKTVPEEVEQTESDSSSEAISDNSEAKSCEMNKTTSSSLIEIKSNSENKEFSKEVEETPAEHQPLNEQKFEDSSTKYEVTKSPDSNECSMETTVVTQTKNDNEATPIDSTCSTNEREQEEDIVEENLSSDNLEADSTSQNSEVEQSVTSPDSNVAVESNSSSPHPNIEEPKSNVDTEEVTCTSSNEVLDKV